MFAVAFVISNRTERIRRIAFVAKEREIRTARLYAMSRELAVARSSDDIVRVAYRHLHEVFHSDVCLLLPGDDGVLRRANAFDPEIEIGPEVALAAEQVFAEGARDGAGHRAVNRARLVALQASTGPVGVLIARSASPTYFQRQPHQTCSHEDLLDTFASQIALAIERARLGEDAARAQLEVQNERLRNALLSSVSHDLRTPLAVIKGAVTAMLDGDPALTPARKLEYLSTISDEASRMNRLVRNLLDMTSLEAGALRVRNKQWQPLEEVIGVALNRLDEQLEDRSVHGAHPGRGVAGAVRRHSRRAALHQPRRERHQIHAGVDCDFHRRPTDSIMESKSSWRTPDLACPREKKSRFFEKFHRAARTGPGVGIGLTICRGIVVAHGGKIWYEAGERGGASFRFILPLDEAGPPASVLPEAVGDP